MQVNGVKVTSDVELTAEEAALYIEATRERLTGGDVLDEIIVKANGDGVDVSYCAHGERFERIRRITGYLVGTIDRWNDAKKAEERERVKHDGEEMPRMRRGV